MKSKIYESTENATTESLVIKGLTVKEKTNKKMMILSCIGIILAVLGHTGDQFKLASNIFPYYSFHMALFIFVSGYFYNPRNENRLWGKDGYILKKTKKLVIPYFIWNLIYGMIATMLRKLNIISYGEPINLKSLFIEPWITGHQYVLNLASWFLLALFLVNITYVLIKKLSTKFKLWNDYEAIFVFFIIAAISVYFSKKNIGQSYIPILRTGFFIFFYQLGYVYKTKIEGKIKINTILYFSILIIIQLIVLKFERNIIHVAAFMRFQNDFILTPIIVSITGVLFWTKISEILEPALGNSKIINYISNNTFDIMLHHLFCVFILNLLIWKISDKFNLLGFDVATFKNRIYYSYTAGVSQAQIIYTAIGVFMPLSARYLYEKIKNKIMNGENKNEI